MAYSYCSLQLALDAIPIGAIIPKTINETTIKGHADCMESIIGSNEKYIALKIFFSVVKGRGLLYGPDFNNQTHIPSMQR